MTEQFATDVAEIGVRLSDDAYMAWCAAAIESELALRDWFDATPGARVSRYFVYRAALDREEAAARDLQRLSELAQPCRDMLVGWRDAGASEQSAAHAVASPPVASQPVSA